MQKPSDTWTTGDAYETYIGRWSRLVASEFLNWLMPGHKRRWIDVGCGTGAMTRTILEVTDPSEVVGIDPSERYIVHARHNTHEPNAMFLTGNAQHLPFKDGGFDIAVSGLVLNFVPDPAMAVAEMRRIVRPGGVVAAYVWDYAAGMQLIRYFWNAALLLDPAALELDEGRRFPLCQPEPLRTLFNNAGLASTAVILIEVQTFHKNFDDYWSAFLGGQGPAPSYCMALPENRRAELKDRLKATLPVDSDGAIRLTARAFGVRGIKPA